MNHSFFFCTILWFFMKLGYSWPLFLADQEAVSKSLGIHRLCLKRLDQKGSLMGFEIDTVHMGGSMAMKIPQNRWFMSWKVLLKWMIWGYLYFRKPPYLYMLKHALAIEHLIWDTSLVSLVHKLYWYQIVPFHMFFQRRRFDHQKVWFVRGNYPKIVFFFLRLKDSFLICPDAFFLIDPWISWMKIVRTNLKRSPPTLN